MKFNMASSSSSDEEENKRFAQIADIVNSEIGQNGSLNRNLTSKSTVLASNDRRISKPSLRHWRRDEDEACWASEFTTPEFRQHIAKKLSKLLDDSYICAQEAGNAQNGRSSDPCQPPGIRLLLSSKQRLMEVPAKQPENRITNQKKRIDCSSSSDSTDDEAEMNRLAEAVVSGYSIIQQVSKGGKEQDSQPTKENGSKKEKEKIPCDEKEKKSKKKKHKSDKEQKGKKRKKHKKEKHKDSALSSNS